jgi:hypothetical protein
VHAGPEDADPSFCGFLKLTPDDLGGKLSAKEDAARGCALTWDKIWSVVWRSKIELWSITLNRNG